MMGAWGRERGAGSLETGASGDEHGDDTVETGAWGREHFFTIHFQNTLIFFSSNDSFFTLAWKHDQGSDYFICSLFTDYIFFGGVGVSNIFLFYSIFHIGMEVWEGE